MPIYHMRLHVHVGDFEHVVHIKRQDSALKGFLAIQSNNVSAVAVVENDRHLVGTLSDSDLIGMTSCQLNLLLLPVMDYYRVFHGEYS
jgi:predicted transcriptional regulator